MSGYAAQQTVGFEALRSTRILAWRGVELAIREYGPDGAPVFSDPTVPCLQLVFLLGASEDGSEIVISTHQDDVEFGLRSTGPAPSGPFDGIYRERELVELPTGLIETVEVTHSERGNVSEVKLTVEDQPILILAGEVRETRTERLEFQRLDESLLVFLHPEVADGLDWQPPRST